MGHERSIRTKINIIGSVIIKGLSIATTFLLVPLTINYIDNINYGIWLTICSLVTWVGYLDIGLNNGLRNKFAEALALKKFDLAQQYVSTTYALLIIIFIPLIITILVVYNYINWYSILNIDPTTCDELGLVFLVVFSYFCLKFILSTINTVLIADQRPAIASFVNLLEHIIALIIIYILTLVTEGSLLKLCFGLCIAPIIMYFIVSLVFYNNRYNYAAPKFSKINFSLSKGLLSLGLKFFILQIAILVQFQTSNIIIIRSFGPDNVTSYNIAFKYFNLLSIALNLFLAPLWSAVTDAMAKDDKRWIQSSVRRYQRIILLLFICGILMLLFSSEFYDIWLGRGKIKIPFIFSLLMFIYTFSTMYGRVYGMVINGIGALKIQLIVSILSSFLYIALCIIFIYLFNLAIYSVLIAGIIANLCTAIIFPIQYKQIFVKNKSGIWTE